MDRGDGVSEETIQLLGRVLNSVPIDDLRQFVALMEAVDSAFSPAARPRRAIDQIGRRRAHALRCVPQSCPARRPGERPPTV